MNVEGGEINMNTERVVAGIFVGAGALLLIAKGELTIGSGLLFTMVGFFVGEKNGARNAVKKE